MVPPAVMNGFTSLSRSDAQSIFDFIQIGEKIKAIKLCRELTSTGLKESKEFVEYFELNKGEVFSCLSGGKHVFRYDPKKEDYINIIVSGAVEFTEEEDQKILREDLGNCPERLLRYIAFRFGKAA